MTDYYAVIGHPVSHSKSPFIHTEFARQTGEDMVYELLPATPDGFAVSVREFRRKGGLGLNVTLPFKFEACSLASELTVRAQLAQAVNTLTFGGDIITGDNTDGAGLVRDLRNNLHEPIKEKRVLLVGAGGAAYGVAGPLLEASPGSLTIVNRTPEKAARLVEHFRQSLPGPADRLHAAAFSQLQTPFDIVINATSSSLGGHALPLPRTVFARQALAYDMMYGQQETAFLGFAREQGVARRFDGTGMLVEQAAESFFIWRHVHPDTRAVIAKLKALQC
jgi:shikimate dehydrogenase